MDNNKYSYLPFATLLIYTFGAFFLLSINLGGVFLSPGNVLSAKTTSFVTIFIMVVVIVLLFISAKKDSRVKNE